MKNPDHAAAMVFSDGVWYDPKDQLFKMWYLVGESASTGYATSRNGIHWDKPSLDVRPPTNIVQPGGRDSSTVWLDSEEKDPARRFKMFRVIGALWRLEIWPLVSGRQSPHDWPDPRDANVHVVGKIDPVRHPTFIGNDMYLSGSEQLRRIRSIVPAS